MCRLLGYVSETERTIPEVAGSKFADFVALSEIHKDSWGIATNSGAARRVHKVVEPAVSSSTFEGTLSNSPSTGGLLHFRWASKGISVTDENAHPFTFGDYSFIHNGTIHPHDALLGELPPDLAELRSGTGDSEHFFLFALSKIRELGFTEGVLTTIRELRQNYKYSGINSMFLSSEYLVVVAEHDENNRPNWSTPDYYELRYRIKDGAFLAASSGWDQSDWSLLPNHHALIVNRKSLATQLVAF
jgi:predicted glutamine amidotransferase